MSIRVLVVDDSRFFRRRVTEMLESDPRIKVIGDAENGEDAVQKAARLKPDVITMDVEMPVMDGITAVRKIMATHPTAILMFSSLTTEGARSTLEAGAADYLPKRFEDISRDRQEACKVLCDRVAAVGRQRFSSRQPTRAPSPSTGTTARPGATQPDAARLRSQQEPGRAATASGVSLKKGEAKLVAIGTSTGGPIALQQVLKNLPGNFPVPLLLIQHMPGTFTTAFAQRLNDAHCCLATSGIGRHRQAVTRIFHGIDHGIAVLRISTAIQYHVVCVELFMVFIIEHILTDVRSVKNI